MMQISLCKIIITISIHRFLHNRLQAEDFLANWSAPEVIQGKNHSQASDIYSFALVLWEILTSIVPFSHIKKQDDIRLQVIVEMMWLHSSVHPFAIFSI